MTLQRIPEFKAKWKHAGFFAPSLFMKLMREGTGDCVRKVAQIKSVWDTLVSICPYIKQKACTDCNNFLLLQTPTQFSQTRWTLKGRGKITKAKQRTLPAVQPRKDRRICQQIRAIKVRTSFFWRMAHFPRDTSGSTYKV